MLHIKKCRAAFPRVNWGTWVWAKHIPPTRSTLVWRLIWAKIPTWDVLQAYGVQGPSICVFCRRNIESMDHIFLSCDFPSAIIDKITEFFGMAIDRDFGFHHAFMQIVNSIFSPRILNIWKLTWTTFFWMIWMTRNAALHNKVAPNLAMFDTQLWVHVREGAVGNLGVNFNIVDDLHCVWSLKLRLVTKGPPIVTSVRWSPPPSGFVKINTDGSAMNGLIQGGSVFRNCMSFIESAFAWKMGKGQAYEAELGTVIEPVSAAIKRGWNKIYLESDSTYVTRLFQSKGSTVPWKF